MKTATILALSLAIVFSAAPANAFISSLISTVGNVVTTTVDVVTNVVTTTVDTVVTVSTFVWDNVLEPTIEVFVDSIIIFPFPLTHSTYLIRLNQCILI